MTNVFCTNEELLEIKADSSAAQASAMLSSRFGPTMTDSLYEKLQKKIHKLALQNGLPEIDGYYGLSYSGEFLKA